MNELQLLVVPGQAGIWTAGAFAVSFGIPDLSTAPKAYDLLALGAFDVPIASRAAWQYALMAQRAGFLRVSTPFVWYRGNFVACRFLLLTFKALGWLKSLIRTRSAEPNTLTWPAIIG